METASQFKSKADKLLGLDDQSGDSKILVQQQGWLMKLNAGKMKSWKRFFCVVKDGFFLWYTNENDNGPFDTKPKGVFPLGGATISLDMEDKRVIQCAHSDIPNAKFKLRAQSRGEAMDWLAALDGGKKATWENALLGNALIEKMKTTGTQLEAEKEEAFQALQEKAKKLQQEREQREKFVARDAERQTAFRAKLEAEKERVSELEGKRSFIEETLGKEEKEKQEAAKKRMSVERKLAQAEMALQKLEEAMIVRNASNPQASFTREDSEVRASVSALRAFFEARAKEQAVRARALYERMV